MKLTKKLHRAVVLAFMFALIGACAPVGPRSADEGNKRTVFAYPDPPDEPRFFWERTIFSDADVKPPEEAASMWQTLTGEGTGGGSVGLGKPYGVAARLGRVYVTDTAMRTIHVFDAGARRYFQIGEDQSAYLAKPLGIDVDKAGNVYVADVTLKLIRVYDRDGKHLRDIGEKGDFDRPVGVAVDLEGERVFVIDIGGVESENHRLRVFDAQTGAALFDVGKRGNGDGEFNLPRDVAVSKDRFIYVTDGGNFRVQKFDWDGRFVKAWGKVGKLLGDFARPKEIATDPDGNVYVVDTAFGNFQIFSPEGEILLFIGNRGGEPAPATYMLPSGIAVDEDGRVYVVDQWFRKVDVFRPAALPEGAGLFAARPDDMVPQKK